MSCTCRQNKDTAFGFTETFFRTIHCIFMSDQYRFKGGDHPDGRILDMRTFKEAYFRNASTNPHQTLQTPSLYSMLGKKTVNVPELTTTSDL